MIINRHNYEEFFLLYTDNELSATERKAVEEFVQGNPDLEEELVMLQQSVLRPGHVVFEDKLSLFKNIPADGFIHSGNYEEYFVLYGDNELSDNEKVLVEQFVDQHPTLRATFELIQQSKLIPDNTLVFPDKNDLYRTDAGEKVIPFPWRKLAVAAIFILFMGGFAWFVSNNKPQEPTVTTGPSNNNELAAADTNRGINNPSATSSPQQAVAREEKLFSPDVNAANITAKTNPVGRKEATNAVQKDNVNEVMADKQAIEKNNYQERNNTVAEIVQPKPDNSTTLKSIEVNTAFTPVSRPVVSVAVKGRDVEETRQDLNIENTQVVYIDEQPDENFYADNGSGNKQRPLRGLFRKVSRVFDKTTNADASEPNKKNIRIAAFEIALK